ncbi:MAG: ABC-type transport auxiliary lipoprotein family protein [Pseudomonadota bacterium]|nr:ABC-type transport auxiliary lipoprotein family protein [Pseudomonadota bacterium]
MNTHNVRAISTCRAWLTAVVVLMLAGCSILGGKSSDPVTIYSPDPRVQTDPSWPTVGWQLSMTSPHAARFIDTQRIAVRPAANEFQVYKDASWAKRPSDMVEDALLRALEDSGRIPAVARQGSGVSADYKLVLDLRRFEADYAQPGAMPAATIEVNAKLLHSSDQLVIASRTFLQAQPTASTAIPDVVVAFEKSLEAITRELAGWVLTTGEAHKRGAHK